jgi:hypothetical protein
MKEMITVEKEVYEAVLRNSVRVNDLEAENEQLKKDIRYGFAVDGIVMEKMDKINAENQQLKELLKECRGLLDNYNHTFETKDWEKSSNLITKIDNAIGEKK